MDNKTDFVEKASPTKESQDGPRAIPPRLRHLHDNDVKFQEYQYYAKQTRLEQDNLPAVKTGKNILFYLIPSLKNAKTENYELRQVNTSDRENRAVITDEEWANASRSLRLAATGTVFYLITTGMTQSCREDSIDGLT